MDSDLLDLLRCPADHGRLREEPDRAVCEGCGADYPVVDGIVCLLRAEELADVDVREQQSRDEETTWYDSIFGSYTNAVELPSTVGRIGRPPGPILDLAAGSGRITSELMHIGPPVVAADYSLEMLRKLVHRCRDQDGRYIAVQADARSLPLRDGAIHATTFGEGYGHFRGFDRSRVLKELSRVMQPGAPLSLTTLNYNLMYRVWKLIGNAGAREGDHLLGGDFYYLRMTRDELRQEISAEFEVDEIVGMRNIPARTLAQFLRRIGSEHLGDRFLDWMTRKGYKIDLAIETTPVSYLTGFFWVVHATKRR